MALIQVTELKITHRACNPTSRIYLKALTLCLRLEMKDEAVSRSSDGIPALLPALTPLGPPWLGQSWRLSFEFK